MERLGSLDAVFLAIEGPTSPMNIGSVGIFEGPTPDLESVQAFVGAKLQLVPRCRQRVRESARDLVRPLWIDDVGFDLRDHLHAVSLIPGRPFALEEFVDEVMVEPLDRSRALWEMWVVDGLADGRWAVVSKVHHCMVDGIAGTDLLATMMDRSPDVALGEPDPWTPEREPSTTEVARLTTAMVIRSIWAHIGLIVRAIVRFGATWNRLRDVLVGAKGLWLQPSRRDSPLTGPIGPRRRWSRTHVSLEDAATIRHAFGGTVNDVVLTAIARGFRALLRARGEPVEDRTVMALVPVSTRTADERGRPDNRVAVAHALLPVGIDGAVPTYDALRQHLDELKRSHQTDASTLLLHTGNVAPQAISHLVARAVVRAQQNLETITTNVPGPQRPLYLCGRRMLEAYPFAPIAGRIRIGIAIWSYCGTLYLGVTGDRDGASDLDDLVHGINQGFEELLAAAARQTPLSGRE